MQLTAIAPEAFALIGLLLAMYGLWEAVGVTITANGARPAATLPALGCFCMTLASVEQFDRALRIRPRIVATWTVAIILWLGTAIIGLLDLIVMRDLAFKFVVMLDGGRTEAGPIAIMSVYFGVLLYIGFVIGGAEYHYKNIGQPNSWKLFSITLLGQLLILILPYLII